MSYPLLADHYDVIVPTMLGHGGGRPATIRPTRLAHIVDDARWLLDELGLEQVHLAGNSLGGRIALELARLGRAQTVCALSPSGTWEAGSEDHRRATRGPACDGARRSALARGAKAACPFGAFPALGATRHRRPWRESEPSRTPRPH